MSLARPEYLWLALLALPELVLGLRRIPSFRSSLGFLAGPRRRPRAEGLFSAFSAAGAVSAALFIVSASAALAGPSWGLRGVAAEKRGLEASVVLDVSRSMEASEAGTTRLDAAKGLIRSLLRSPPASGASFSLIAAKGKAVLLVPMTEDAFATEGAIEYANPEAITAAGTDLESGLRAGLAAFTRAGAQGRIIFLFSDGGELSGSSRRACEEIAAARARLVVVGLGGEEPVLVPGPDGKPLAGPRGPIRSGRDETRLKALAALAGGAYIDANDAGASAALAAELAGSRGVGTRVEYERVDRSGPFILLALAFLVCAILADMLSARGART